MSDLMITLMPAIGGGILLGLSAVGYLYVNGRIAGISGLIAQLLAPKSMVNTPALWFLLGLILTAWLYGRWVSPTIVLSASPWAMAVAGLLVGFGTQLGSGCTSGHGICGISRLSPRSMVATATFMLFGFMTVFIMRHGWGQ